MSSWDPLVSASQCCSCRHAHAWLLTWALGSSQRLHTLLPLSYLSGSCFCFTVVGLFVATGPNRAEAALEFLILLPLLLQACANTAGFHFNTSFLFCFVFKVPQMIPIGNQGGDPELYQTDMVGHGDFSMTLLYVLQGIWSSSV